MTLMNDLHRPYLRCRSCQERFLLPFSTLEEKSIHQAGWPSDTWQRTFLCLRCGHVYVYTQLHAQWEIFRNVDLNPLPKDVDVVLFEIGCATEGCKSPVRFHAAGDILPISTRTAATVAGATFHDVSCDQGHPAQNRPGRAAGTLHIDPRADADWWK